MVFTIIPLIVKCKISIISSTDSMECLLSKRCFRFSLYIFEIPDKFLESYMKESPSPIYFLLQS